MLFQEEMSFPSVAVVGGGVSGLYIANNLLDKNYQVTLFERNGVLGGRVRSISLKSRGMIETGAGRFNEKHKILLKLIQDCGLRSQVSPISNNERAYNVDGASSYTSFKKYIAKYLFDSLPTLSAKYTKEQLKAMTMKELLMKEFKKENVEHIINAFGYNSEFEIQNAYTTIQILTKEFNDKIQYFYLKGGLSQIVECLHQNIIEKGGKVLLNTTITNYDPKLNILSFNNIHAKYDKVVFACTKKTLMSLHDLIEHDMKLSGYLRSIEMAPLNRIFAVFPVDQTGVAWFHDIKRTTTDLPIRYIIPLNPQSGLIQVSYTDNLFARYWHSKPKKQYTDELMKYLKEMFPDKNIPEPTWIRGYYWEEGATYWKPYYKQYRNLKNYNYYIAGEIMSSTHSGWIEGALESAQNVLRLFTIH